MAKHRGDGAHSSEFTSRDRECESPAMCRATGVTGTGASHSLHPSEAHGGAATQRLQSTCGHGPWGSVQGSQERDPEMDVVEAGAGKEGDAGLGGPQRRG